MAHRVIGNIFSRIGKFIVINAVGHILGFEPFYDIRNVINLPVQDEQAVFRELMSKLFEGITDFINIMEKVHMVFFYI